MEIQYLIKMYYIDMIYTRKPIISVKARIIGFLLYLKEIG